MSGDIDPIWLEAVDCLGYEEHVVDCSYIPLGSSTCPPSNSLTISCSGRVCTLEYGMFSVELLHYFMD